MSIENDFDKKSYALRIMKSKGFDTETSDEVADIFGLQWPAWQDLLNRHRIGDDLSKAEQLLTTFIQRETFGGATKVIEAFAKHLDAQPKQTGSPDWTAVGYDMSKCGYCEGRGVVSNIPCRINRNGEIQDRIFSFACVCDRGRYFGGIKTAPDFALRYAADRGIREAMAHWDVLDRYGIDPNASSQHRAEQFHRAIRSMKEQVGNRTASAKTARPAIPKTPEEARKILADRQRVREQLNPDRIALAVYASGDARNEWE